MGEIETGLVSGAWVSLLFVAVFGSVFGVPSVFGSGTIYIRADGTVEGTDKIQRAGDVYTFTGNILDSIVVQRSSIIVDGNGYTLEGSGTGKGLYWSNIDNVTVRNTSIKNFETGVYFGSSNNNVSGNTIANCYLGVRLGSSDNIVSGNTITNSSHSGVIVVGPSNNCTVFGNTITYSTICGVYLDLADNYTVAENIISNSNIGSGVSLSRSNSSAVFGNTIRNSSIGLGIGSSNNNGVSGNTIANSTHYGVRISGLSQNNKIFHNDIIYNRHQAYSDGSYSSIWDDSYPSGGNYWSDYSVRYPDAKELDDSGIWDTPYFVDVNNQDRYPLMNPWDKIPPVTTDDYDRLWHATDFTVTLEATDDMSGVAETYYKINNEATKTTSRDGQPRITTEGADNNLEYWSLDRADNTESHHILFGIRLDKTPPMANAGADQTVSETANVTLDASASTDENQILSYKWAFMREGLLCTLDGKNPSFVFAIPGAYTVTLLVVDVAGNQDTDTVVVTVNPAFPLWGVVAIGIVVAGIVVAAIFLWKRQKKP